MSKQNTDGFNFIIFFSVLIFLVFPPIFSTNAFTPLPKPEPGYAFLFQPLKIFFAAAFEEVMYRAYLPHQIKYFLGTLTDKCSFSFILIEGIPVLLFALAHKYLGLKNVIFAFAAGAVLRFLFIAVKRKTNTLISLITVCLLHGVYNLSVYFIIWFY